MLDNLERPNIFLPVDDCHNSHVGFLRGHDHQRFGFPRADIHLVLLAGRVCDSGNHLWLVTCECHVGVADMEDADRNLCAIAMSRPLGSIPVVFRPWIVLVTLKKIPRETTSSPHRRPPAPRAAGLQHPTARACRSGRHRCRRRRRSCPRQAPTSIPGRPGSSKESRSAASTRAFASGSRPRRGPPSAPASRSAAVLLPAGCGFALRRPFGQTRGPHPRRSPAARRPGRG
jgi:hypothetical protein